MHAASAERTPTFFRTLASFFAACSSSHCFLRYCMTIAHSSLLTELVDLRFGAAIDRPGLPPRQDEVAAENATFATFVLEASLGGGAARASRC